MTGSPEQRHTPPSSTRSMFHVKHPTQRDPRRAITVVLLALAALVLAGCGRLDGPEGWAAPVADGDLLLVQLDRGVISAGTLSESGNFTQRWHFPTDDDDFDLKGIYANPIIEGGVAYIAAFDGSVIALDTNNGRPIWDTPLNVGDPIVATPAIDNDFLYVPTEKGEVVVVRRDFGTEANRYLERGGRIWSQPVIVANTLYLAEFDGRRLASIDLDSGSVIWDQPLNGGISANLALASGRLILGSLDRSLQAYSIGSAPAEAWTFDADGWIVANALVAGDTIYIATLKGSIYAIDTATGREIWHFNEPDLQFRSQPALSGGTLVVADRKGSLRGLNPTNGERRWERELSDADMLADPLEFGSRLLFVTRDGELVQVNPADGTVVRTNDGEA
jgi:outer membrane protein assembly factor BamB